MLVHTAEADENRTLCIQHIDDRKQALACRWSDRAMARGTGAGGAVVVEGAGLKDGKPGAPRVPSRLLEPSSAASTSPSPDRKQTPVIPCSTIQSLSASRLAGYRPQPSWPAGGDSHAEGLMIG